MVSFAVFLGTKKRKIFDEKAQGPIKTHKPDPQKSKICAAVHDMEALSAYETLAVSRVARWPNPQI